MAEEQDNIMLRMLREIRGKLDEHDKRFDQTDEQLRDLRKSIEDWKETTATGVGFAAHANIRTDSLEKEIAELKRRIDRIERSHWQWPSIAEVIGNGREAEQHDA